MKFKPANHKARAPRRSIAGFTMAEVLAAMMFMAIVIPVAIQGLRVASLAGEVAQRKSVAARIANQVLNELKVTGKLAGSTQTGVVHEAGVDYRWSARSDPWNENVGTPMTLGTVTVVYAAEGRDYDVHLSTLVSSTSK